MRITRILLPGVVLLAVAGEAFAQHGNRSGTPASGIVPSVRPVGAEEPAIPTRGPIPQMPPMPTPPAVAGLEDITSPQPGYPVPANPVGTLTGQPLPPPMPGLPPGSYPSPYYVDGPGCCGPLGRNGRIGYEVYTYTGVNIVFGEGLPERMNAGWTIGGGARTLFFSPSHTSAWTVDFGGSYTHNWAAGRDDPLNLFLRSPPQVNQFTGTVTQQPDRLVFSAIREVHRSSFNYNFGRDVWLMGSGNNGGMHGTNLRVGAWIGGRYGTSHVDVIPLNEVDGYARRQNVFLGIVGGAHATVDVPVGGWILFGGTRVEYGYDWTNLVPPIQGNIHNVNIQLTAGIRF